MTQARTIRLPAHVEEQRGKVVKASRDLAARLDRDPSSVEIGAELALTAYRVEELLGLGVDLFSLDAPVQGTNQGADENATLGDFVADQTPWTEDEALATQEADERRMALARAMAGLSERERIILARRFGLDGGEPAGMGELGEDLGGMDAKLVATFEARALSKLRHPSSAHRLAARSRPPDHA